MWLSTSCLCPFPTLSLCTLVFHFLISPCVFNLVFSPPFLSVPLLCSSWCCFFYVLLLECPQCSRFWSLSGFVLCFCILNFFLDSLLLPFLLPAIYCLHLDFFLILAFFVSSLFFIVGQKKRKENERSRKDVEVFSDVHCGQVQIQRGHWRLHWSTPQIRLIKNTPILYQSLFFPKPHLNFPALHSAPYLFFFFKWPWYVFKILWLQNSWEFL